MRIHNNDLFQAEKELVEKVINTSLNKKNVISVTKEKRCSLTCDYYNINPDSPRLTCDYYTINPDSPRLTCDYYTINPRSNLEENCRLWISGIIITTAHSGTSNKGQSL